MSEETKFLNSAITLNTTTKDELRSVLIHYTITRSQIDKLGRKLFNDRAEKYRNSPMLSDWDSLLQMLVEEYWKSSERLDEADLISKFPVKE
jgi:hypothetical protein